jgi:hypothetical protein
MAVPFSTHRYSGMVSTSVWLYICLYMFISVYICLALHLTTSQCLLQGYLSLKWFSRLNVSACKSNSCHLGLLVRVAHLVFRMNYYIYFCVDQWCMPHVMPRLRRKTWGPGPRLQLRKPPKRPGAACRLSPKLPARCPLVLVRHTTVKGSTHPVRPSLCTRSQQGNLV